MVDARPMVAHIFNVFAATYETFIHNYLWKMQPFRPLVLTRQAVNAEQLRGLETYEIAPETRPPLAVRA